MAMTNRGNFTHRQEEPDNTFDTSDPDFGVANGPNNLNVGEDTEATDGDDSNARGLVGGVIPSGSQVQHNSGCGCEVCAGPIPNPSAL